MRRAVKISMRVLVILIVLLLMAVTGAYFYVKQHQQQFISFLESETEKGLNGATLHIGDITVGFKGSFPLVALTIDSVYLRDSLWNMHHHDLLSVNQVYATINFWQLFQGKIDIQRLELDKPDIYFYTDSLGYSNTSVFRKKKKVQTDSNTNQPYPVLDISNARFTIDERVKHKLFDFHINELSAHVSKSLSGTGFSADLNLDCLVEAMAFNEEKGPFLKNKSVRGAFRIFYDKDSRQLNFDNIHLAVDQQPFVFTGKFYFAEVGTPFLLSWYTRNLSFRKGASFLSPNLQKTLEPYDIAESIDSLSGSLNNSETQYHTPLIHLWLKVQNRNIKSPFVAVDHASFTATFNNEAVKLRGHEDSNTVIHFSNFRGDWENFTFRTDSIVLSNLIHPAIKGNVISDFDLNRINPFLKENTFSFVRGTGKINLTYAGSLDKQYDISRFLTGDITVTNADIHYLPKNFHFTPVNGVVRFTGKDMSIDHLVLHAGGSDLTLNGKVKSIFYFINHLNEKYSLDCSITSNRLNVEDFSNYFTKQRKSVVAESKKSSPALTLSSYISKITSADFNISLNVKKLIYKKITADSLQATLEIKDDELQFKNVRAQHVGFPVDDGVEHKYFGFRIHDLDCSFLEKENNPLVAVDLNMDMLIQAMTFKKQNGSFLQNKSLQGAFRVLYNRKSRELNFDKIPLAVDQQPFIFTGKFFFAKEGTPFLLSWTTKNLLFRKAASFLPANLQKTLEPYDIEKPIASLTGSLNNLETQYATPLIHLWLKVENSNLKSPFVDIENASFTSTFNNEAVRFRGHEDSNTVIHFSSLKGNWEDFDFHADSVVLTDLIHPRIKTRVRSDFKLEKFNSFMKEDELSFTGGTGKIDLTYFGSLDRNYDSTRILTGSITLSKANVLYAPRHLRFSPVSGVFRFTGKDLMIENLTLHSGSSDLTMNGKMRSIFYFINEQNEKYSIDWSIKSEKLNLDDFNSFLQPQATAVEAVKKQSAPDKTVSEFISQFTSSDYNISLRANEVTYKKFLVDSLRASIILKKNAVQFRNVAFRHGKGSMLLNGFMKNDTSSNSFALKTEMKNIDISRLFYVFDNFGLQSITDKNILGSLSANISMQGTLTPNAELIKDGFNSNIHFNLRDGQLLNFAPLVQINQKILKKRNMSDVRFADLYDSIEVRGENIKINRMEIRSSVLTLFVNGMYNIKTGPDMSIQVPLSNLKANKDSVMVNKGIKRNQGISVRLRVRRGPKGKLDVSWDPFDKANKEMNKKEN